MTRVHTPNVAVLAVVLAVLTLAATPMAVAASPGDTTTTGTTIGDQLDGGGHTSDGSTADSSTDGSTTSDDSSSTSDDSTRSSDDSSGGTEDSTGGSTTSDDTSADDSTDDSTDSTGALSLPDPNVTTTTDAVLPDRVADDLSATTGTTEPPTGSDDATTAESLDSFGVSTLDADVFDATTAATSTEMTGTVDATTGTLAGETDIVFEAVGARGTGTRTTTSFEPSRLRSVPEATQSFDDYRATRVTFGGASLPDSTPAPSAPTAGLALGVGALAAAGVTRSGAVAPSTLAALGSSLGSTVAAGVAPIAGQSGVLDRLFRMLAPFRYSRYDDSDPLEHDARAAVFEVVTDAPGAYLSEVAEEADLPLSTARHHIRVLEREDLVSGAKVRGKRRFYPAYTQGIELAAALNDEATAAVIDAVARFGAASVSDLADDLDRDPSTVSHHLKRLAEDDIVVRERDGRAVMNKLSAEARTALEPEQGSPAAEAGEAVASD